ncbi:hypothetical protein ACVW00_002291 [Marmoricola sp. URHA0025 HA25]
MSTLAPDEKLCPFCAETIKAAAVKCRFCQSDLAPETAVVTAGAAASPPIEPEGPAPALAADPEPGFDPEVEPASDLDLDEDAEPGWTPEPPPVPQRGRRGLQVVAALVVLCLVLAGTLWFLVDRSRHPHLGTAPDGQVTDTSFRNAAMSAASDAAAQALSYSWQTFDQDRKKARALMGSKLAKQYDAAMDQVAQQTATSKLTLKATVLSAGLLSAEEHKAKVLLFVNTLTTREGSKKQQLDQNRVVMTLTRKDGDWTVSQMDAF